MLLHDVPFFKTLNL